MSNTQRSRSPVLAARLTKLAVVVLDAVELVIRRRSGAGHRRAGAGASARDHAWGLALDAELASLAAHVGAVRPPRVVVTREVANAGAGGGRIYLNAAWLEDTARHVCADDDRCRRGLVRGLAAHELSHHVRAQAAASGRPHVEELTADAWAGCLLARTGGDPRGYLALVGSGPDRGSATHPPPHLRVAATLAGARVGAAGRGGCDDTCGVHEAAGCRVCGTKDS